MRSLNICEENGVTSVRLPPERFDTLQWSAHFKKVIDYLEDKKPMKVVLQFADVMWFGSEQLGATVRLAKRVRTYGGDVCLSEMSDNILQVFSVCQLVPAVFKYFAQHADAVESF